MVRSARCGRRPTLVIGDVERADWLMRAAIRNKLPLGPDNTRRLAATASLDPGLIEQSIRRPLRTATARRSSRSCSGRPGPLVRPAAAAGDAPIEPVYCLDNLVLPTDRWIC